ncbi:hypothetical protein [Acetivibrio saccincola]|jgi:hypothetical protein|uniref:hypothetical protein n=1 Tax=Acetivibrio saccincola TaxID=1677857 RepID=UPI000C6CBFF7|nr:hypothetical protein [Acetivibrio saccincola]
MLFAVAAIVFFIILLLTNDVFFNWKFERHHKVLGWYMKPLFIYSMKLRIPPLATIVLKPRFDEKDKSRLK